MENILFSIFIQYNAKICWWKNSEKVLHICHRRCVCCRHIIISGKYRIMDNWFCLTTVSPQAIFICVCVCVFVPNQELIAWKNNISRENYENWLKMNPLRRLLQDKGAPNGERELQCDLKTSLLNNAHITFPSFLNLNVNETKMDIKRKYNKDSPGNNLNFSRDSFRNMQSFSILSILVCANTFRRTVVISSMHPFFRFGSESIHRYDIHHYESLLLLEFSQCWNRCFMHVVDPGSSRNCNIELKGISHARQQGIELIKIANMRTLLLIHRKITSPLKSAIARGLIDWSICN